MRVLRVLVGVGFFLLVVLVARDLGASESDSEGTVSHGCEEESAAVAGETVVGVVDVPGGSVWFGLELEPHRSVSLWVAVEAGEGELPDPVLVGYRSVGDVVFGATFGAHATIDGWRWYPMWSARRNTVCVEVTSRVENGSGSFSVHTEVNSDKGLGGGPDGYSGDIAESTDTAEGATAGQETEFGHGPTHKVGFLGDGGRNDEDWFKVELKGGFDYRISVVPDPETAPVDRLEDPAIVGIFDEGGAPISEGLRRVSGSQSSVDFTPSVDGEYFVAVGSAATHVGLYLLCVDRVGWLSACNPLEEGAATSKPAAVSGLTLVPGTGQLEASWAAPRAHTGEEVAFYEVEWKTASQGWDEARSALVDVTRYRIAGLASGIVHDVRVTAVNSAGYGPSLQAQATPSGVPHAPGALTATPADGSVTLTWASPVSDGGLPVTNFQWRQSRDGGASWAPDWADVADGDSDGDLADERELTVSGLTNGDTYTFEVRAVNARGESKAATVTATPASPPDPPSALAATPADGSVTLTWTAPVSDGGLPVTNFQWRQSRDGGASWAPDWADVADGDSDGDLADERELTVSGLTNGDTYTFEVRAVNARGESKAATVTATPASPPDPPSALAATPADGSVTLTWTAPVSDGGLPVTNFQWRQSRDGGASWAPDWADVADGDSDGDLADERELTVSGLTNGDTYTFEVRAVNARGESKAATVTATPASPPDAPSNLAAVASDGSVTLTWTAPVSDGGSEITEYQWRRGYVGADRWWSSWEAVADSDADSDLADEMSHTVSGLFNGTEHKFEVRAANDSAPGDPAGEATATPQGPPEAPSSMTATPGNLKVSLSWREPVLDGGSDVTGYRVEWKLSTQDWAQASSHDAAATARSHDVTSLTNGTSYDVRIAAKNTHGTGPYLALTAAPTAVAGVPKNLRLTGAQHHHLPLEWEAPDSAPSLTVTDYLVEWRTGSQSYDSSRQHVVTDLTYSIGSSNNSLTNNTIYYVKVTARNGTSRIASAEGAAVTRSVLHRIEATVIQQHEDDYPWLRQVFNNDPIRIVATEQIGTTETERGRYSTINRTVPGWSQGIPNGQSILLRHDVVTRIIVHEYAHHFTLDHEAANETTAIGIGWVYFTDALIGSTCLVSEIYADLVTYVTLGGTGHTYITGCSAIRTGDLPTTESQNVARSVISGETPQWFTTTYSDGSGGMDLDSLWADTRVAAFSLVPYLLRDLAGGYCSNEEAVWAFDTWKRQAQHAGYGNPWVDGGCLSRRPQELSLTPGDGSLSVAWEVPLYTTTPSIDQYVVQWRLESADYSDANKAVVAATADLSHTIGSLTNGSKYFVRVAAINSGTPTAFEDADGHSRAAENSATPMP